ncbi:Crp/Fnr family transcriptional regulator [Affinirhizobium pseudoryzae]|uniref:Crp/Fnr family transcriptional regulator n=1 Tax=Allorhizobium pseudoryzae TaxID=379684 RepID=UPI0013ED1182
MQLNRLLSLLPEQVILQLKAVGELVHLDKGEILVRSGTAVTHVYFPVSGIASVVAVSALGKRAEAGLVGREGYSPAVAIAGAEDAHSDVIMQIAGRGWRFPIAAFERLQQEEPVLQQLMVRALLAFNAQVAATALSNAVHSVEERLTRWLLMCHDRVDGNEIALTHDFIALMLAVRRPSVTSALHVLEGHGFIRSERGRITIRNRVAMEQFARDAYGKAEGDYRRLMRLSFRDADLATA